jgi:hypothetical protein
MQTRSSWKVSLGELVASAAQAARLRQHVRIELSALPSAFRINLVCRQPSAPQQRKDETRR